MLAEQPLPEDFLSTPTYKKISKEAQEARFRERVKVRLELDQVDAQLEKEGPKALARVEKAELELKAVEKEREQKIDAVKRAKLDSWNFKDPLERRRGQIQKELIQGAPPEINKLLDKIDEAIERGRQNLQPTNRDERGLRAEKLHALRGQVTAQRLEALEDLDAALRPFRTELEKIVKGDTR